GAARTGRLHTPALADAARPARGRRGRTPRAALSRLRPAPLQHQRLERRDTGGAAGPAQPRPPAAATRQGTLAPRLSAGRVADPDFQPSFLQRATRIAVGAAARLALRGPVRRRGADGHRLPAHPPDRPLWTAAGAAAARGSTEPWRGHRPPAAAADQHQRTAFCRRRTPPA